MTTAARTASLITTGLAVAASALTYPFLPRRVATHFDPAGRPDRSSSRLGAVFTVPAIMAGFTVLNDRLGSWPGGRDREDARSGEQAREQAIVLVQLSLLPAHLAILARGIGLSVDMSRLTRGLYGMLLVSLGNILPKLPRNGLIGIRTPWTLADPAVWERTHRVAGYLCWIAGLLTLASLLIRDKRAARVPVIATLAAVALSTVYSFVAYTRRGSARQ